MLTSESLFLYALLNTIGLILIVMAILWPKGARGAYVVIFGGGAIANGIMAFSSSEFYVESLGPLALSDLYKDFIYGFFREHTREVLLGIAAVQLLVAILLTQRGFPFLLGVISGSIFLITLAPLGAGAGLPAPIVYAVGLIVLYRRMLRDTNIPYNEPAHNGDVPRNNRRS